MWIAGAKVLAAHQDGTLLGGAKKVVWHTTENDPKKTSAIAVARYLNTVGSQVHLVWNPETGEMVQMIPANRGGRGLENRSGGVQTNNGGSIVFQIEVVGRAKEPWTSGPCKGLETVIAFLRQLGVDDVWPSGDLKPYPASYGGSRSTSAWAKEGHFGHSQVPENVHGDPGDIDQKKITGSAPSTPPASSIPPVFSKPSVVILNVGSRGPAVVRVQKIVGAVADGIYGPNTKAKVLAWQKSKQIPADGIWGPQSEAAYKKAPAPAKPKPASNPIRGRFPLPTGHFYGVDDRTNWSHSGVRGGNDKYWVLKIQKKVGASADGIFGPNTRSKVIAWQRKNKLSADGKVGAGTWAKMLKV
jgi:peptidoglycan hydrolase-like protein with peptidoglycan-binding domain